MVWNPAALTLVMRFCIRTSTEGTPAKVFATLLPDILVVCASSIPHMAPLVEQHWEQFSRIWNSGVKMSLLFSQAALTIPLPAGATVLLISSGAALGVYTSPPDLSPADFIKNRATRPTTEDVARAVIELASDQREKAGKTFVISEIEHYLSFKILI
ncbi:hypothetical protein [Dictyobacter kobayashii]|uniref:Short-chain dehydrogenase n=1 Tax=Dictyobacter kobayashii TaxID=2014872 RepID=A0A402AAU7_9CHLR|nr:hypothetical protein [Dictyobacter kobayashii]GCE16228.1 short-chain dehydrogenase [Dictyobacter kobayashii]